MSFNIKIDKNKEVVGRLPFEPFKQFNNLCVGHLIDVQKTTTESKPEAKWEYAGKTVPMLVFTFQQHKLNASEKDRFMSMSFTPVTTTTSNGEAREMSKIITSYTQLWDKVKHLHDQYLGNDNYKPMDANPEFTGETTDARLAEFDKFFDSVVSDFKVGKDGRTPIYNDKQNLAIVMVASGDKKSYLAVPDFVGKGIFDLFKTKDGQIDTYLRIASGQTVELGVGAASNATMPTGGNADLPPELLAAMGK